MTSEAQPEWLIEWGLSVRGRHIYWGRQDYTEPAPISEKDRTTVASVSMEPTPGKRTWNTVFQDGKMIGYVSTRLSGQSYRTPDMDFWMHIASDWNRTDPAHGHAVLALLTHSTIDIRLEE